MRVEWYGQSAFALEADGVTVFVDPFGDMSSLAERGIEWNYPAIAGVAADLVLVTHEHRDHNAVDLIEGEPQVIRALAGTHESPIGTVIGVSSEHDPVAGTQRGHNTIFVFELGGVRVAHFGDFGQSGLREEQAEAIGTVDLALIPVGGGPTIGAEQAQAVAERVGARWIVPHHYRTERISFLEPADDLLSRYENVERLRAPRFDTAELPDDGPLVVLAAAP
jgi:L-ascorbate metabolism protein UlaG (beta-lactamase superfamily)